MKPYLTAEYPLRLAHRGSRLLWPENTMAAFQGAVDLGYHYVETDVRADHDGTLYLFHDRELRRLTNGAGAIADWRGAELGALDAAYHFRREQGYPERGKHHRIPTLEEVLLTFPELRLNIDLKGARVASLLPAELERHGAEDRILAGGFLDHRIWRFRDATEGRVATSTGPLETAAVWAASRFRRGLRGPADALQVPEVAGSIRIVDAALLRSAAAVGVQVHVWTVNDPADMHRLLDMGVDGIVTDRPDLLNDVVSSRRA